MVQFNDIVLYLKDLFKMNTVYDCARPFLAVSGIFGIGGSRIREIEGVPSVQNTGFSLVMALIITLIIMPYFFIRTFCNLFLSGEQRSLVIGTSAIILSGAYGFLISTAAMTCIQTHIYCKNLSRVLQILNNTDMMLRRENMHVNYWKIVLTTILCGLMSCDYFTLYHAINHVLLCDSLTELLWLILKLFIDITCNIYFMFLIVFLLIIRERFGDLNKLLLQNAHGSRIMRDNTMLRRISLARDLHEQLSEAIVIFSDASRYIIVGVLVPGILRSLFFAICILMIYNYREFDITFAEHLVPLYLLVCPLIKIVILTAVCETHKNNRRVLSARLRQLIAYAEDRRIVHQLKQYILYNHSTVAGLVDFQLIDVDFTLLFMVIDIVVSYIFVIHSHFR